jgi:Brp/Blh family beta-carotene 15,15'-monooxygenase
MEFRLSALTSSPLRQSVGTGNLKGSPVPVFFWPALAILLAVLALGIDIRRDELLALSGALMLIGGLPHGAYDIALARRALGLGALPALRLLAGYLGVAMAMWALWSSHPIVALGLFMLLSAVHFGQDWDNLNSGLLKVMAGGAVIAIPAFTQPQEVSAIFTAMAGDGADIICRLAIACAPISVLVTLVGMAQALNAQEHRWVLAQFAAMAALAMLPPQVAFTLFFVFLHAPLHMRSVERELGDWSRAQLIVYGLLLSAACVTFAVISGWKFPYGDAITLSSSGFKILSVVAAPHLLLSTFVRAGQKDANR